MPLTQMFRPERTLIGMVHAMAFPGTPYAGADPEYIAAQAAREAQILVEAGFDTVIIENMHDRPYVHGGRLGPEIVAGMTRVGLEVASAVDATIGVQILSGGTVQALAVAQAIGGAFIRCENFVYAHVADEGLLPEAEAGRLLRERSRLGAQRVAVYADIKKKHASHAITADIGIEDAAHAAAFFGADGLVVTGAWTARPADPADADRARRAGGLPVLVGSGVTAENVNELLDAADGVIVGSSIKIDGQWENPVDPARAGALVKAARG